MTLRILYLTFILSLSLSAQTIVGTVSGSTANTVTLSAVVDNNAGSTTGADPCQAPQLYFDALGTFGGMLDSGSTQNFPVQPIPGTSPDDAISGLKYLLGTTWYYACRIHNLGTQLAADENTITGLTVTVPQLVQQISFLQSSLADVQSQLGDLNTRVTALEQAGLNITNISAACSTGCTVTFTTSEPAWGYVKWGTTGTGNTSALETTLGTTHSISIQGGTSFKYYVCAIDANDNQKCSPQPPRTPLSFPAQ